jgi:hypothetical protein
VGCVFYVFVGKKGKIAFKQRFYHQNNGWHNICYTFTNGAGIATLQFIFFSKGVTQ